MEPGFEQVESELSLTQLISALPEKQREVVVLRYVHELKLERDSRGPWRTAPHRAVAAARGAEGPRKDTVKGAANEQKS